MRHVLGFLSATLSILLVAEPPRETRLRRDVAFLASPDREGRGNGSPGLDAAARYVAKAYRDLGLTVEVQRFPFVHAIDRLEAQARLRANGGPASTLCWGQDVEAYGFSGDGHFEAQALVFVNDVSRTPDAETIAEEGIRGRVVVLEARRAKEGAKPTQPEWARIQRFERLGATAVVFLEEGDRPHPLGREEGPTQVRIPVLSLTRSALAKVCPDRPLTMSPSSDADAIVPLGVHLDLTLRLRRRTASLPNVIARIPGRNPRVRGEYIVLGAHLDHLGLGERHSRAGAVGRGRVHPGADDNASGTAMVLELARELRRNRPQRSVLLLHPAGEEEGLLGSSHWVRHPTVPLPSVKFMVNFDMVGRLDPQRPTLSLGGLGAPKALMDSIRALAPSDLTLMADSGMAVGGSDHLSFAAAKIPTLFFFTGVHTDYHQPTDTADRLNYPGMAQVTAYALKVVRYLAEEPNLPPFDPETARLPQTRSGPLRAAFGSIPDFSERSDGFRIQGTRPGSPAEALGLQAGDVIIRFADRPIRNLYDFQEALSACKPGASVEVEWRRGETTFKGTTVLQER